MDVGFGKTMPPPKEKAPKVEKSWDDVSFPRLPRSQKQTFRLGTGSNGKSTWIPMADEGAKFHGWAPVGDHLEFVGKNWENAPQRQRGGHRDEYEDDEYDDEEGEEYFEEGQFDDADDVSRPDVQRDMKSYRTSNQKEDLDEAYFAEFPDDGYDYSQHLKIPGGGIFIPLDVDYYKKVTKAKGIEDAPILATHDTDEVEDKDIDNHLYNDDPEKDKMTGELDDDFIVQANGGDLIEDESQLPDPYEERARRQTEQRIIFGDFNDFNEGDFEIEEEWEEYDDEGEMDRPPELDEAFEKTLNLYDDDDIGEVNDADPQLLAKNVDVTVYEKELLEEFPDALKKKRYVYVAPIPANNEEITEEDTTVYDEPEEEMEEIELPKDAKWDAETILTSYTNTENHPVLIAAPTSRKIKLSKKTGMPLGVLPTKPPQQRHEPEEPVENKGKARGAETAEEKKERKKQLKDEKRHAREQKKAYKVAFKQEELRQTEVISQQHVARKVVVKY